MLKRSSPLFGAAVLLVDMGAMSSLFAVFRLVETGVLTFPALPVWCVCLLGCYGTLCRLLRQPRALRTLVLICVGFAVVQVAVSLWLYGIFAGAFGMIFTLGAWITAYFHAYTLAQKPPRAETIMASFEICVLALLFALLYCSVQKISFACALPALAAALVALAALVGRRTASGRDSAASRGGGTVLGALAAFGLGALLLAGLAAGAVKTVATALWRGFLAVMRFLGDCIRRFVEFLAALTPDTDPGALPPPLEGGELPPEAENIPMLMDPAIILYVLAGLAVLVLLVALVYMVIRGGGKRRRVEGTAGGRVSRQRIKPGRGLLRFWRQLKARLRFHALCLLRWNTVPGLFIWLERRWARQRKGRLPSETCREYLLRLQREYPGREALLLALADELDAHYFGPGSRWTSRDVRALRKKLST